MIDLMDGVALIYSNDAQTYLGRVSSNCYLADSIVNTFGTYGSPYSATSIRNPYGLYGSPYYLTSAFDDYTTTPPIAWMPSGSTLVPYVYVTTNRYLSPAINSAYLISYLQVKGGCTP